MVGVYVVYVGHANSPAHIICCWSFHCCC